MPKGYTRRITYILLIKYSHRVPTPKISVAMRYLSPEGNTVTWHKQKSTIWFPEPLLRLFGCPLSAIGPNKLDCRLSVFVGYKPTNCIDLYRKKCSELVWFTSPRNAKRLIYPTGYSRVAQAYKPCRHESRLWWCHVH